MALGENEIYVHVFFVDIVSLSDPKLGTAQEQKRKIETLRKLIKQTLAYKNTKKMDRFISDTGDGAAICFKKNVRLPLDLAIELHKKLRNYNKNKKRNDRINVRIGINSGTIQMNKGLETPKGFWGRGIINARRIMDIANPNNILLDSGIAKELINLAMKYKNCIHHVGKTTIKHESETLEIYSAHGNNFGNKTPPNLLTEKSKKLVSKDHGRLVLETSDKNKFTRQFLFEFLKPQLITRAELKKIFSKKRKTKNKKRGRR